MTEEVQTCSWKHTPFSTPYVHPRLGQQPGFNDEWTVSCVPAGTLRIEPRSDQTLCPYCGKLVKWLTDPSTPGLPNTIPRLV